MEPDSIWTNALEVTLALPPWRDGEDWAVTLSDPGRLTTVRVLSPRPLAPLGTAYRMTLEPIGEEGGDADVERRTIDS